MRIGKIAMGTYMVNMAHGLKPDELKKPEKTSRAKSWLKNAKENGSKVTEEKCDNTPENITFRTEDWLERSWAEAGNPAPEDPSKGKLNITHIPGDFAWGRRITKEWVAVGSTDKVDKYPSSVASSLARLPACFIFISWLAGWRLGGCWLGTRFCIHLLIVH